MNELEYKQWRLDAAMCLSCKYSESEVLTILRWFDRIKGAGERDLIGELRLNAFSDFSSAEPSDGKWSLYNSLMSRLWIYAPYILE